MLDTILLFMLDGVRGLAVLDTTCPSKANLYACNLQTSVAPSHDAAEWAVALLPKVCPR